MRNVRSFLNFQVLGLRNIRMADPDKNIYFFTNDFLFEYHYRKIGIVCC